MTKGTNSLRYYPVNLDLRGKTVVVVGGGRVAARKVARLVASGALVTVVAPELDPALAALAAEGRVTHLARGYRGGDLAGACLAFAATGDHAVNGAVAAEAKRCHVLVDRVDAPESGDFTTPALLSRGELLIAVSTGGASPALAREILARLEQQFGPEYAEALELLGGLREKILTAKGGSEYNERVFSDLAALDLPALIRNGSRDQAYHMLLNILGPELAQVLCGTGEKEPS